MNKKPLVVFDIDDTLINHSGAEKEASIRFGSEFQNEISEYSDETFAQIWHDTAEEHIRSFLSGKINFEEQRRRRIKSIFRNVKMKNEEADEIFKTYLKIYEDSWHLFDDVLDFFKKQNDVEFAILSDGSQEQQELKLKRTQIHHHFKFIITAESERLCKPDPKFFLRACKISAKQTSNIYYIGDNLEKDAIGASKAGLRGIWLNRNENRTAEDVDMIKNLSELNGIIERQKESGGGKSKEIETR